MKTHVFSTGSSAVPTIAEAPKNVQTGGFGDPNGVPARETNTRAINIGAAGAFDLPTGTGSGNGTGGTKGVRGVVASTGFGSGIATGEAAKQTRRGACRRAALATPKLSRWLSFVPSRPTILPAR